MVVGLWFRRGRWKCRRRELVQRKDELAFGDGRRMGEKGSLGHWN